MALLSDVLAGARARVAVYGGLGGALSALGAVLRREGWRGMLRKIARVSTQQGQYPRWIAAYEPTDPEAWRRLHDEVARLPRQPLISVVVPVYNTPASCLTEMIESVLGQIYPHWELCIADDASSAPHVREILDAYAGRDSRVRVAYRAQNGHICAASNSALELATGEFVALLDHDDLLSAHALAMVVKHLNAHPRARLLYSDEDKVSADGKRSSPFFKADWDPELILQWNVFSHLGVFETHLLREIGGFRAGLEGSQDYDLVLRSARVAGDDAVVHIPHVLYHWRAIEGSTAVSAAQKPYAQQAARTAVAEHLIATGADAEVLPSSPDFPFIAIGYRLPSPCPMVHIVVDARGDVASLDRHIANLFDRTAYESFHVTMLLDECAAAGAEAPRRGVRICRVPASDPQLRVEMTNRLMAGCDDEYVCLLDDSLEILAAEWLDQLVRHAARPEIGLAGAMLRGADGTTWAAGLVMIGRQWAVPARTGAGRRDPGYFGSNMLARTVTALPRTGIVTKRSIWAEAEGLRPLPEVGFAQAVDLSTRIAATGLRHVLVPAAEIATTRDAHAQETSAADAYPFVDPRYSPNLSLGPLGASFELAFPPRVQLFA